jgi:hypothetical protein
MKNKMNIVYVHTPPSAHIQIYNNVWFRVSSDNELYSNVLLHDKCQGKDLGYMKFKTWCFNNTFIEE